MSVPFVPQATLPLSLRMTFNSPCALRRPFVLPGLGMILALDHRVSRIDQVASHNLEPYALLERQSQLT